ncbi:hypothetical protein [Streptomyces sp. G1]|uniref:hypothetical protein n=1 Tax=Streptomyces sp. G1 TaxID=361572 RepID=UPI00202EDFF5|nr:hypothetical protein [Streptomyces sp. G1]MCM1967978.1 hypothetical protein [Streptomyces sp. G1]
MSLPDYRITGYVPGSDLIEDYFEMVTASDNLLTTVAEHHSVDGRDSYLLLYDAAAIYDYPGAPAYVAMRITRDPERQVFDFTHSTHPLVPLAQSRLIEEGCPPDLIEVTNPHGPRPADALTSRLEGLLKANSKDRYRVLDHFTDNPGSFDFGTETWTLLHDRHPDSADAPYRLFLEEVTKDFRTYTVREGAFTSAEEADAWVAERNTPLPKAPEPHAGPRANAARARTTTAGVRPGIPPAPVVAPGQSGHTTPAPNRRGTR